MSNYDFVKRKGEMFLIGHEGACTYMSSRSEILKPGWKDGLSGVLF